MNSQQDGKYLRVSSMEEIKEFENHSGRQHDHNMIFIVAEKL
ncbi:MAG: hypothetical protein Q8936_00320 [Bacillota bacterium]|nr:hypothetical protein [Bacillota bacterium]